jgi:putative DNA methylase
MPPERRAVTLSCADASETKLKKASFDAVLTDPPYFGNVQYAELMDFCYVWLRRLAGADETAFAGATTRNQNELTGNLNMDRGLETFAKGLSRSFQKAAYALRPGAPFVCTYHHNQLESYLPVAVAILYARLVAPLPSHARRRWEHPFISTGPVPPRSTPCSSAGAPTASRDAG